MSQYDIYVFLLCLIVFVLLTVLSVVMLTYIVKLSLRLIRHGAEDEKIISEYEKALKKKHKCGVIDTIVTVIFCAVLLGFFGFSTYINCQKNAYSATSPTIKVVQSGSMSKKHEKNTYLYENDINDQIQTFDLILVYQVPDEFELELYDVVLYEVDDMMVLHRIVGIEEPNERHPEHRHFLLQGDNVENPDRFPVLYSQMKAIYRGQRVPFIGSFVTFMQSPAGWLCIFLIVVSMIATPIVEKLIEKEKRKRLAVLGLLDNAEEPLPETEEIPQTHPFAGFGARDMRSFAEKLADADEELKAEYAEIEEHLRHIEDLTVRDSRKYRTFRRGRVAVARCAIRGKTLNASLGLDPAEYAESKYVFKDETQVKSAKAFPMRVKVTSARQVRWTKELITDIVEKYGLGWREFAVEEIPNEEEFVTEEVAVSRFAGFGARDMRSFAEKLADADEELKAEYAEIEEHLRHIEDLTVRDSRKYRTFRRGRVAVARCAIRGKTLNASLGLDPAEYTESKYVFKDETQVKSAKSFPMRVKVTSARQVRWTKELITDIVEKYGLGWREFAVEEIPNEDEPVTEEVAVSRFAGFGARDMRSFAEKLADAREEVKARYADIENALKALKGVRVIEGKKGRTFKCGNVPVARFAIRGKTLNVYLALPPTDFENTKYIYTDVSNSKKYARYPMRVKVTSARKTRWVKELVEEIAKRNALSVLEGVNEK
ncbi:MAG: hypothetical protein IJZ32_05170 [Clostridia bacterium]|nr:hypothetical protein [Clostridia bacterium]